MNIFQGFETRTEDKSGEDVDNVGISNCLRIMMSDGGCRQQ